MEHLGPGRKKSKQFMTRLMVPKYLNYGIFTNLMGEKTRIKKIRKKLLDCLKLELYFLIEFEKN